MKRLITIVTILCIAGIVISYGLRVFRLPTIGTHRGDGTLEDFSRRVGPFAVPGYRIRMETFDLSDAKQAEYHIANMPEIRRDCAIMLGVLPLPAHLGDTGRSKSTLFLEVLDSTGSVVVRSDGRLEEYSVYQSSRNDFSGVFYPQHCFFSPNAREEYTIRILYTPDGSFAEHKAFVLLECGGGI
jgi:hypothetical protein